MKTMFALEREKDRSQRRLRREREDENRKCIRWLLCRRWRSEDRGVGLVEGKAARVCYTLWL